MLWIISNIKYVLGGLLLSAVLYGIYDYSNLKANLEVSELNNSKLTELISSQENTISNLENDIADVKSTLVSVNDTVEVQNNEIEKLRTKFNTKKNGESRDFGKLAYKKSKLLQKIINKASLKVNRCFELASGATLSQGETNSECQEYINNSAGK